MKNYYIILAASGLIILSHVFTWVAGKTKVPSVLLLIGSGAILQFFFGSFFEHLDGQLHILLKLLGTIALIFIILEGALDLSVTKHTIPLVKRAFFSAFWVFVITANAITTLLVMFMGIPLHSALAYAIPLSTIGSAIAISTAVNLSEKKREFVVYESTFSDIIGILAFNYIIMPDVSVISILGQLVADIAITVPIAIAFLIFMLVFIRFSDAVVKLVPILAVVIAVYAITKIFHLPALLLILAFGLLLKNLDNFPEEIKEFLNAPKLNSATGELKSLVTELSFLIRTFFFIVFGYTIPFGVFLDSSVLSIGATIFLIIVAVRFTYLQYILKTNFMQEALMAPRGLVTVILFFNIPSELRVETFNDGIVYFIILASGLLMMLAFAVSRKPYKETPEMFAGN